MDTYDDRADDLCGTNEACGGDIESRGAVSRRVAGSVPNVFPLGS